MNIKLSMRNRKTCLLSEYQQMATMSFHSRPNPDYEFVLHGGKPSATREVPGFIRNSMLTHTTGNLSQHEYHPEEYWDDSKLRGSLRTVSRSLNRVSGDLRRSLLMEDKDNARPRGLSHRCHSYSELNDTLTDALNSYRPPRDFLSKTDWYTKPIHLTSDVRIPMKSEDMLATHYFPITLGETKSLELVNTMKPGKKNSRKLRSKSAKKESVSSGEARRLDNLYLMTAEAPHIGSAGITFTSPYCDELAKLRMEKLRIEEKQYLELKRQAELEKIRGPKPKWYELKGPEFHYEARKNTDLLRNSDKWDELLQYRENLLDASTRLKLALDKNTVPVY